MQQQPKNFDVIIVGAGVTGSALFYILAKYTDIKKIALIEKYDRPGQVNSRVVNNSQTLHFGDIETNYDLARAKSVKRAATMVKNYVENLCDEGCEYFKSYKLVLGIGAKEVAELRQRFDEFRDIFPNLKKLERADLAELEPKLIEGRDPDQPVFALHSSEGYAIDYEQLSKNFVTSAMKVPGKDLQVFYGHKVSDCWSEQHGKYLISTDRASFRADVIEFAAGAYGLHFAKKFGLGRNLITVNVAGNFYFIPALVKGKVYRVQVKELPFAAAHADPELYHPDRARVGPTAKIILMMERHNWSTVWGYLKTLEWSFRTIKTGFTVLFHRIILKFMLYNVIYDLPYFGKRLFLNKEVKAILPTLKPKDLKFAKRYGGVRPQILDLEKTKIDMGAAKIFGRNIIFNITPSPGATQCLGSAEEDAERIVEFLGKDHHFHSQDFEKDLCVGAPKTSIRNPAEN